MTTFSLAVLGPFSASINGRSLTKFRSNRTQALLIYLAVEKRYPHPRESLMALLWPEMPLQSAQVNLRQTLYQLRQLASGKNNADVPLILADRQTVQLHPDLTLDLDVDQFSDLLHKDPDQHQLKTAVSLYRSDFLSDFYLPDSEPFEEWAAARRADFRQRTLDALDQLTTSLLQDEEFEIAKRYALKQIEIDNLHERGHRHLMEILVRLGQRSQALAQYEKLVDLLKIELDADPSPRTTQLANNIRRGLLQTSVQPTQRIRGYELQEKIGAGAFGIVYRALQPVVGREVAIKVIASEHANQSNFIRRFEAEARIIARLEHPHIVPLYDYWREPDGAYLVMRYFSGGSLETRLQEGPLELATAVRLIDQISAALAIAHRQNIIHRDIKPANILLDDDGNAYLSDFGIAKQLTADINLTQDGGLVGSPAYLAPEQALGETVTPQTDIYSLGVVLYEMLTGEHPFANTPAYELIYKHAKEPLPSVLGTNGQIPPEVEEIIQQATAKIPSGRFLDSRSLAQALKACVNGVESSSISTLFSGDMVNPYKGLRPFDEADAPDFYGRDALIKQLVDRMRHAENNIRFLAVVGPSGSGKSSVVKAGLLPVLRNGGLPGSASWFVMQMTPGTRPFDELEIGLLRIAARQPGELAEQLQRDAHGLIRAARLVLPDERSTLLLVIDQFEELFTAVDDMETRQRFLDLLTTAAVAKDSPIRFVVTLRADFYDRPLMHPQFGQLMRDQTELVLPLTAAELGEAIRAPAQQVGAEFEEGLVTTIVADIAEELGVLPMLQYALRELFERRDGRTLTHKAYREIGGVSGALARRAEEIFNTLEAEEQAVARQLFLRLVTLGEGVEDTRRRMRRSEVEGLAIHTASAADVIDQFGAARLLTFDHDPESREPTIEVAHEALLREWPRLRSWLDESRDDVRLQRMLAVAAAEWHSAHRDEGLLLRGTRLDQFSGWQNSTAVVLTENEQTFLKSSLAARDARVAAEEERRQRELKTAQQLAETEKQRAAEQTTAAGLLRRRAIYLSVVLGVAVVAAVVAGILGQQAQTNADLAFEAANAEATAAAFAEENLLESEKLRLAAQANAIIKGNASSELGSLLALRSLKLGYSFDADSALVSSLTGGFAEAQLRGHKEQIRTLRFSPDGRYLISFGGNDGTARLWEVATKSLIHTFQFDASTNDGRFSDDGTKVFIAGSGSEFKRSPSTVYIYDVATFEQTASISLPRGIEFNEIWSMALSPDGAWMFVGIQRPQGYVIDLQDPAYPVAFRLRGHRARILSAVFSNDSETLLTTSGDHNVILWDFKNGEVIHEFSGHDGMVTSVELSPDGQHFVTNSWDGAVRLWDLATREEILRLEPDQYRQFEFDILNQPNPRDGNMLRAAFSPDGRLLIVPRNDESLEVWSIEDEQLLQRWADISGDAVAISPDGQTIATSNQTRLSLLSFETRLDPVLVDFGSGVHSAAIGPDGKTFVYYQDENISLWSVDQGERIQQVPIILPAAASSTDIFASWIAYAPDLPHLLLLTSFRELYRINLEAGESTYLFGQGLDPATGSIYSEHGAVGLSADGAFMLRPWPNDNWGAVFDVNKSNGNILELVQRFSRSEGISEVGAKLDRTYFSPDKRFVVNNIDDDNLVEIWKLSDGKLAGQLRGHTDIVFGYKISADSQQVVTGGADGSVRLWDIETHQELKRFTLSTGQVTAVAIDPQGEYIIAGSDDGLIRLWDIKTGTQFRQWEASVERIESVMISPDGQWFLTLDGVGQLNMWYSHLDRVIALACQQVTRDFTDSERRQYGVHDPEPTCQN